jgi:hypothetical protein
MATRVARSLTGIIKKIEGQLDNVQTGFLEKIAETLVSFSPVDTGAYVESHSINTSSGSGRSRTSHGRPKQDINSAKGTALDQLLSDVAAVSPDASKVFMNNRSPHNKEVEFGGYNWGKDGYYVYTRTRAMAPQLLEEAIREAKG